MNEAPSHQNPTRSSQLAEKYLSRIDPILASLIQKHGSCPIFSREINPYGTLIRSVISQQLSAKAADTIEGRVVKLVGGLHPAGLLAVSVEGLRGAGLSAAKARYIREISQRVVDGRLDFDRLRDGADEEILVVLTEIPGVGRWTAEMFLIFGLGRSDVLAMGDAGLRRAFRLLYGETADLAKVGELWRPYRSVASWYLWKHLDG
jgi:DNA-3-methyladenine glycosylase II